jgi:poly(3-hydroxyalkanoate) synthetase
MRTTTVIRNDIDLSSLTIPTDRLVALNTHLAKAQSVFDAFKTAHGITSDNLVSRSEGAQVIMVRSWPDLETAQAWVDCVLSGALSEGLDYYPVVVSAQVDPE